MADAATVRDIAEKLENGVKELMSSDKYAEYLKTMSRFRQYSTRNTLLIHLQSPEAKRVGGFRFWQEKFNRHVKKGEHGIKIFAPVANKGKDIIVEKLDPVTKMPVLDDNGQPIMETLSPLSALQVRFKLVTVFSEQQTEGEPLPELVETLTGDVERYELFMDALRAVSPLPIVFEALPPDTDGTCYFGDRIAIREGMSEIQTVAAVIHEITHAKLHDQNSLAEGEKPKSAKVAELEAEGVAYVTSQAFQIDTGANSFGYLLQWDPDTEMKDFNASLDTIRKTAAKLIDDIDGQFHALAKERGIDLTVKTEEKEGKADMEYTALQKKGFAFAEAHANLPLQERLNIIAETFGYTTASVETHPCTGKWRGTSDIAIVFDDDKATLFIGNERTPDAKKASVISECVNNALAKYNPQTVAEAKQRAGIALMERERADNAIAAEHGLKQYKFLNVELNDGSNSITGGYLGWYYVTVAVDGKIFGLCESGLNSDIARGEFERRENYFVAGGLRDTEPNFVFNNVGHSSESASYKMELSGDALLRARETLARRERFNNALEGMKTVENHKSTIENNLYDKLSELFPDFMNQKYSYLKLESPGFEPLSLEWIFGDRISVMHTYTLNGDLMYDPMIEFHVNSVDKTMTATMFEQSMPPLYQYQNDEGVWRSFDGNGRETTPPNVQQKISDFALQWFSNLEEQEHIPIRAILWNNGGIDEVDVEVLFDENGNALLPEPEKQREPVGCLTFADSGEVLAYYSADEMLAAYKREMGSIGPENVRFSDVVDNDLERKLYAAYVGEYGEVFSEPANDEAAWHDLADIEDEDLRDEKQAELYDKLNGKTPQSASIDLSIPDPLTTAADRDAYGYSYADMLPMSVARALELFDTGHCVYLLYPDNTEAMAFDRDEIRLFDGLCGIERDDWENSPVYKAQLEIAENGESAREADLLFGNTSKFGIYQVRDGIDDAHDFRFANMRELEALGLSVDRANYELVYTGELPIRDTQTNLHRLFSVFQHDSPKCPTDFTFPSVSVSDVIVLQWRGEVSAHFIDSVGFKELSSFTGNEREQPSALSQVGTRQADKTITQKPATKAAPTLLGELAEAKQLVTRGEKSTAKQNEREV